MLKVTLMATLRKAVPCIFFLRVFPLALVGALSFSQLVQAKPECSYWYKLSYTESSGCFDLPGKTAEKTGKDAFKKLTKKLSGKHEKDCIGTLKIYAWGTSSWMEQVPGDGPNWVRVRLRGEKALFIDDDGQPNWRTGYIFVGNKNTDTVNMGSELTSEHFENTYIVFSDSYGEEKENPIVLKGNLFKTGEKVPSEEQLNESLKRIQVSLLAISLGDSSGLNDINNKEYVVCTFDETAGRQKEASH